METERSKWKNTVSKCFVCPQRYILSIMVSFAVFNAYTLRVCLSMTIVEMVVDIKKNTSDTSVCPIENVKTYQSVKNSKILYAWNEETQGLILSSFFWGYIITHLPGGVVAEKIGGKHVLGVGVFITAIVTLITPLVITATKGSWIVLTSLRIIEGLAEGTTYPAVNALLGQWIPSEEKTFISSLAFAGAQIGTIVTNGVSGQLIAATKNWDVVFYFFGGLGVLWYIIWQLICYSNPNSHPFISHKEKEFLYQRMHTYVSSEKKKIPWKHIFTSVPLWALIAAQFGHDWGFFTILVDLPKYLKSVLKFDIQGSGWFSALPHFIMWIMAILTGYICDYLITKKYMTITMARKVFTTIGSMGPAVFMILASYCGCHKIAAVSCFTIAMGLMGTYYSGMKVNALDLSPNFAGTLMAIVNGLGVFAGIIAPYLVGIITKDATISEWRIIFWISFIIFTITNIIYIAFASGEIQPWNDLNAKTDEN